MMKRYLDDGKIVEVDYYGNDDAVNIAERIMNCIIDAEIENRGIGELKYLYLGVKECEELGEYLQDETGREFICRSGRRFAGLEVVTVHNESFMKVSK